MFPGQGRWPAHPDQPQHEWEYARASLPPALLAIWSRMRAGYPLTALGNAVVPDVVAVIGQALLRHWETNQ